MNNTNHGVDALVRHSRLSLMLALVLIVCLGAGACALLFWPAGAFAVSAGQGSKLLPIAIIILVGVGLRSASRARFNLSDARSQAVLNDELRQSALNRAYRNAFVTILALQPLLACGLTYLVLAYPLALMAAISVTAGAGVLLTSLLCYDR